MLARTPMMLSSSSAACAAVGRVTGKSATATTMPPGAFSAQEMTRSRCI